LDYRILGPLEVCDGDRRIALGGDKQRALLAMLLLRANEVVSADQLIDDLWGERPPATALKTLQAYVSRLRKALGDGGDPSPGLADGGLATRGHGYLLSVAPGELDVERFRALVEKGRHELAAGVPQSAADTLRAGLAVWRGPPLADFAYEAFAQAAIAQLEELHLGAIEERIEADLALGRHGQLVGELRELVERHPLRDRLRGQLMLALYRSGRQAEALEVYQEFRRALSEELGLEPGPGLHQLELAILRRDAALAARAGGDAPAGPGPGPRGRLVTSRSRGRLGLAVGGAALVAFVVAAVVASSGGGAGRPSAISADSVGAISPTGGAIRAVVPVGSSPSAVAVGAGSLWVSSYDDNTVSRIDPATHSVVETIPGVSTPSGIAVGAGAVWVANNFGGTVSRIDPAVNRVVQTIPVGNGPSGVAVGFGSVWVTNSSDGTLTRIDAVTGVPGTPIPLGGGATDVATGLDAVWVSDASDARVLRVNPQTNQVTQAIGVGAGPSAITVGDGYVWVANSLAATVSRIDPLTNQESAAPAVGRGPDGIAVGAGGVWVANELGGSVSRIDPATGAVTRTFIVGNRPRGVAVAGGLVWVSAQASPAGAHRGGTLTVLLDGPFGSLDPTVATSIAQIDTLYMTNDGLTAFKRVGGSDGAQLVPDLATSVPTPSDGGLTYTFRLRPGIRYSNGAPVRPEDFRRAIERTLELGPGSPAGGAWPYYESIVGGAACVGHTTDCDLSRGIVTDDVARTVTFHLVAPDPEFPKQLAVWTAVAVPAPTPNRDIGTHPLPSTGPYQIARVTPHEVTLDRNPYFHEWSHAAQPDGYPDRIVWRIGAGIETAVTAVERGSADYTIDGVPADRLGEAQTRFASQLKVFPNDVTTIMGLNTRVAPFNDVRVRQAISYAVDRARLATLLGQDSRPTCQMLPPYIPGYQPYCPYTLNPNGAGKWSAPDLPKARALIAASGTRGTPVTIWSPPPYGCYLTDFTAAGPYLVSLLERLGYPTHIKTFRDPNRMARLLADSRNRAQAFLCTLAPNYPAASEFLGPQLSSCQSFVPNTQSNYNAFEFCDPQFDNTVRAALAAEAAGSPSARALWAQADRQFTNQAPVVPFVTPSINDLVSRRVGNYQYNPQLGVLIDQLWVR
jgi:peptide/nickel transport system substrate-binding protein